MIFVLLAPTASGKSSFAKKIFSKFKDPILVNADAFQIYQDMNIGTAKITKDDQTYSKYSLIDIKKPSETYSSRDYQKDFRNAVDPAIKDGRDVIVVGGTGLYIKAALYDYEFFDNRSENDVGKYDKLSNEELYSKLLKIDENAAKKIHINNRKRLIRALDIFSESGEKKSEIVNRQKHELIYNDVRFAFVNPPREKLYEQINSRVDKMFNDGLIDEVKELIDKYELSLTASEAIGYKEVIDYLNGKITLDEAKEIIKKRTRNYAKRQITFFKHQFISDEFSSFDELENKIIKGANNDK
jgi:tRNA dimethylallyltransferase